MSSAFNIPAGYKLVPLEPTQLMWAAARAQAGDLADTWTAMLAAAPPVDAVPGEPVASERIKQIADTFAGQNGWDGVDGAPGWLVELVRDVDGALATPMASRAVVAEPVKGEGNE